jgi:hypothetical protein
MRARKKLDTTLAVKGTGGSTAAQRPCQGETALLALCKEAGERTHHSVHQCIPLADTTAVEEVREVLVVALSAPEEGMFSVDAGAATRPPNPMFVSFNACLYTVNCIT